MFEQIKSFGFVQSKAWTLIWNLWKCGQKWDIWSPGLPPEPGHADGKIVALCFLFTSIHLAVLCCPSHKPSDKRLRHDDRRVFGIISETSLQESLVWCCPGESLALRQQTLRSQAKPAKANKVWSLMIKNNTGEEFRANLKEFNFGGK